MKLTLISLALALGLSGCTRPPPEGKAYPVGGNGHTLIAAAVDQCEILAVAEANEAIKEEARHNNLTQADEEIVFYRTFDAYFHQNCEALSYANL